MSEVTNQEQAQGEGHENEVMTKAEQLENSYGRVLSESKKYKSKYQEARAELDSIKQKELEEQGKWQELLEKQKTEYNELMGQLRKTEKEKLRNEVSFQVSRYAQDAHDPADLLRQEEFLERVEMDEEGRVIPASVESALGDFRKTKPYLFKQSGMRPQVEGKPAKFSENKPKSINSMTDKEASEYMLKNLKDLMKK